jgi:hypothetical protein
VPFLIVTCAHADILSQSSPFLGNPNPDFDPVEAAPEAAVEDPAFAPFSPADSDIGVQQILGTYRGLPPVQITLDAALNYTNNAPGATRADDGASWFFSSTLAASWRPLIAYGWFADVGVRGDVFRFERSEAVDFENFQPYIGVVKSIPELDDLVYFARYEYQRITGGIGNTGDYWANRIRTGVRKDLLLTSRYQLSAGLAAGFDLSANDDQLERNEYLLDVTYTYWFMDNLSSTLSWGGGYWDFRDNSREDWNNTFGLELTWTPCPNARIYSSVFYTNHNSNTAANANDYEAWQTGIGVGLNYSF